MSELTEARIIEIRKQWEVWLLCTTDAEFCTEAEESIALCDLALAQIRAQRQEPVAEVTYSNWNGMNVCVLVDVQPLPVGTKLYAAPQVARDAAGQPTAPQSVSTGEVGISSADPAAPDTLALPDCLEVLAARLSDQLSPAEKRELAQAATALRQQSDAGKDVVASPPQLPPLTDAMYHAVRGSEYNFSLGGAASITGYLDDDCLDEIWDNINTALRAQWNAAIKERT
jgi:hypothetical protein